jgi:hypothetical protein
LLDARRTFLAGWRLLQPKHNKVKIPVLIALEAALTLLPCSFRNPGEAGFNLLESVLPQ